MVFYSLSTVVVVPEAVVVGLVPHGFFLFITRAMSKSALKVLCALYIVYFGGIYFFYYTVSILWIAK